MRLLKLLSQLEARLSARLKCCPNNDVERPKRNAGRANAHGVRSQLEAFASDDRNGHGNPRNTYHSREGFISSSIFATYNSSSR